MELHNNVYANMCTRYREREVVKLSLALVIWSLDVAEVTIPGLKINHTVVINRFTNVWKMNKIRHVFNAYPISRGMVTYMVLWPSSELLRQIAENRNQQNARWDKAGPSPAPLWFVN